MSFTTVSKQTGVLSNTDMLSELKQGNVVIEPYCDTQINTSSYDVTLGEYFYRERTPYSGSRIYNMYDEDYCPWGTYNMTISDKYNYDYDCLSARTKSNILDEDMEMEQCLKNIRDDEKVILINPGENLLCHTNEFIGGRGNITTMMKARSSIGRNFLQVCSDSGWGDVGYTNRWTMEIYNRSKKNTLVLVVGRRIAQIVFFYTGKVVDSYEKTGKYQTESDMKNVIQNWKPSDMLPKLYRDKV